MGIWKNEGAIYLSLEREGLLLIEKVLESIPPREFNNGNPTKWSALNFIATKTGYNVSVPAMPCEIVLKPGDKITIIMEKK